MWDAMAKHLTRSNRFIGTLTSLIPHLTPSSECCLVVKSFFFSPSDKQFLLKGIKYLCFGSYDYISRVENNSKWIGIMIKCNGHSLSGAGLYIQKVLQVKQTKGHDIRANK